MAKRMQLVMWQRGDYAVAVVLNGTGRRSSASSMRSSRRRWPAGLALLAALLREACEQALRMMP